MAPRPGGRGPSRRARVAARRRVGVHQCAGDGERRRAAARRPARSRVRALLSPQGVDACVAILGALKAGKAFAPLDPSDSLPRLRALLGDLGAQLVLAGRGARRLARELAGPEAVLDVAATGARGDDSRPRLALPPERLACVFLTSGSTGSPKGVADCHRNLLHNVLRYTNGLRLGRGDRLSLVQSPSFSETVSSLLGGLLNGASVHPFDLAGAGLGALAAWRARRS